MKLAIVVCEGAADEPADALQGRTPLQAARMPWASRLAVAGRCGLLDPGVDLAESECVLAAMLGFAPKIAAGIRRAPLEAQAMGHPTAGYDAVYRGTFMTLDQGVLGDRLYGKLSETERDALRAALQDLWPEAALKLTNAGPAGLFVMLKDRPRSRDRHLPPGESCATIHGRRLSDVIVRGRGAARLRDIMKAAGERLPGLDVNAVRIDLGEDPANFLWLWGGGRVERPAVELTHSRRLCVASQSRMVQGLALLAGAEFIRLHDPWGDAAVGFNLSEMVEAVRAHDVILVYVTAPHALGRHDSPRSKALSLAHFDQRILGPLVEVLESERPFRIVLTADRPVSSETGRPLPAAAPLILAGDGVVPDGTTEWSEEQGEAGALGVVRPQDVLALQEKD